MPRKRLGDVLVERQNISLTDLESILERQRTGAGMLGELLLESGLIEKSDLIAALEQTTRIGYLDLAENPPKPDALKLVPRELCLQRNVLPHTVSGRSLAVAMVEPQNLHLLDELSFVSGMKIEPRLCFAKEMREAIDRYLPPETPPRPVDVLPEEAEDIEFFSAATSERSKAAMREFQAEMRKEKTPAVRMVSSLLHAAFHKKASDIHIEPAGDSAIVRIRVDGMLRELHSIPEKMVPFVISRIKILSDMDIAERRAPQDGRFLVQFGSRRLDLRVSTLPTHEGEKVVMRVLDPAASCVSFEQLGFAPEISTALTKAVKAPHGMVLVTGPTGSGKSTTLYSALNMVRCGTLNIVTVEDPVEYKLEGINQVQVNVKAGLTFASCLRSMLRQDPNIIMVGEIRDQETAEIALQAAQTGHLVLSTLHTNDSVAAVTRLLDLGVPAFLIASSVRAILAQRLVRKLCKCAEPVPNAAMVLSLNPNYADVQRIFRPVGCSECDHTGYRGRVGVYELLLMDDALRSAIRAGDRDDQLRAMVRSRGMRFMQEDAVAKVSRGLTTVDEIQRVVPFESLDQALKCSHCENPISSSFFFCPYCAAPVAGNAPKKEVAMVPVLVERDSPSGPIAVTS